MEKFVFGIVTATSECMCANKFNYINYKKYCLLYWLWKCHKRKDMDPDSEDDDMQPTRI